MNKEHGLVGDILALGSELKQNPRTAKAIFWTVMAMLVLSACGQGPCEVQTVDGKAQCLPPGGNNVTASEASQEQSEPTRGVWVLSEEEEAKTLHYVGNWIEGSGFDEGLPAVYRGLRLYEGLNNLCDVDVNNLTSAGDIYDHTDPNDDGAHSTTGYTFGTDASGKTRFAISMFQENGRLIVQLEHRFPNGQDEVLKELSVSGKGRVVMYEDHPLTAHLVEVADGQQVFMKECAYYSEETRHWFGSGRYSGLEKAVPIINSFNELIDMTK